MCVIASFGYPSIVLTRQPFFSTTSANYDGRLCYVVLLLSDVKRSYMIRHKLPGPYEDTVGPTILAIMLMISITAQFAIKLLSTNTL